MARDYETALVLRGFGGLDQSKDRTLISYSDSPDCVNMSTEGGSLRTARGYRRIDAPNVPGGVKSMGAFYRRSDGREWILCANAGGIYAWSGDTGGQSQSAWEQIYVPESGKMGERVDFLNYQDKENDVVLMADGVNPVLTWSGSGESHAREGITQRFAHIEMNYERVWGAGAPGEPDTVYWSRQFDVGDWTGDVSDPDNGGGFLQAPTWNGGKIRLISALFGDIVIFKDQDVLKVSGTYPGEYQVSRVTGTEGPVAARTVCQWGDKVYFLGRTGLCFYDGMRAGRGRPAGAQMVRAHKRKLHREGVRDSTRAHDVHRAAGGRERREQLRTGIRHEPRHDNAAHRDKRGALAGVEREAAVCGQFRRDIRIRAGHDV